MLLHFPCNDVDHVNNIIKEPQSIQKKILNLVRLVEIKLGEASPIHAHSHFPHNFWSSYNYFIQYQSVKSLSHLKIIIGFLQLC